MQRLRQPCERVHLSKRGLTNDGEEKILKEDQ